jgi:hypothetical protein
VAESTASKNFRLTDYIARITHVSLHSADPGTTGASEIAGGSPAYARKVPSYSAPAAGATNLSASLIFDVESGDAPSHYGLWAGATFLAGNTISGGGTFSAQGTYTLTSAQLTA